MLDHLKGLRYVAAQDLRESTWIPLSIPVFIKCLVQDALSYDFDPLVSFLILAEFSRLRQICKALGYKNSKEFEDLTCQYQNLSNAALVGQVSQSCNSIEGLPEKTQDSCPPHQPGLESLNTAFVRSPGVHHLERHTGEVQSPASNTFVTPLDATQRNTHVSKTMPQSSRDGDCGNGLTLPETNNVAPCPAMNPGNGSYPPDTNTYSEPVQSSRDYGNGGDPFTADYYGMVMEHPFSEDPSTADYFGMVMEHPFSEDPSTADYFGMVMEHPYHTLNPDISMGGPDVDMNVIST